MPNEIDRTSSAQRRSSKLLTAMAIFICLGIAAYMVLTLLVNRQTPATPDTCTYIVTKNAKTVTMILKLSSTNFLILSVAVVMVSQYLSAVKRRL